MSNVTHWKKLHNPDYLGAYALEPGEELIVTISQVKREMIPGNDGKKEECTVLYFSDPKGTKPMILNVTNAKMIQRALGSPYIEQWTGKQIQLYATEVKAFGERVEALRVRPSAPIQSKPELSPGSDKWNGAVASIKNGSVDVAGIKKYYYLSPSNEKLLCQSKDI